MALGIPVVTFKVNEEYQKLSDLLFTPETYEEFVANIDTSIEKRTNKKFIGDLIKAAQDNSSTVRARQLKEILEHNL